MIKKNNILKHRSLREEFPPISSSKFFIPDWFKKTNRLAPGRDEKVMPLPLTFKACSAFSDSFISGYMMPLAVDIAVKQTEAGPSVSWNDPNLKIVSLREKKDNYLLPTPNGYSDSHFVWNTQHQFKIPKGYSALMTHPLNRYDLPFITLSGIIDGEFTVYEGNVPVFFKEGFEGIIPAETPIAQILLFKTENWTSILDDSIQKDADLGNRKSGNKAFGWYKQNIWNKKTYD
jgi:hypothetical protein